MADITKCEGKNCPSKLTCYRYTCACDDLWQSWFSVMPKIVKAKCSDYLEIPKTKKTVIEESPIHEWFELSYSGYLVLHRTVLQSMPVQWQKKFVKLLDEIENILELPEDLPMDFIIKIKNSKGQFLKDPYSDYERGRRRIPLKGKKNAR